MAIKTYEHAVIHNGKFYPANTPFRITEEVTEEKAANPENEVTEEVTEEKAAKNVNKRKGRKSKANNSPE